MADRDRYDDDYRPRRDREEEGFFDRIQGWFRGEDRPRRRGSREDFNRGTNRWNAEQGNWYNRDRDRNQDWERTRQWRQNYGQEQDRETRRSTFGNQYGENYGRSGSERQSRDRDYDRYGSGSGAARDFDYSEGYGRSYNRGTYGSDRDRDMNRDWDQEYRNRNRSSSARIYDTDWYDWNFERGFEEDDYNRDPNQFYGYGQNYDWDAQNSAYRGRQYGGRGQRRGGQYGSAGMGSDFEGSTGQYRSAGMRSDYGGYGYDRQDYGEDDLNYRRGDIGYESEGAFYQDLDEPVNFTYYEIWMIPGEFTGMGPQNYKRSDERIKEEVCERLTRHGRIDASNMEIDVKDGEVTLKGTVQDREMKRLAEDTAESISGVRQVNNEVRVQRQQNYGQQQGRDWDRYQSEGYNRGQSQQSSGRQESRQQDQQIPSTGMGTSAATAGETSMESGYPSASSATGSGISGTADLGTSGDVDYKRSQLREEMEVIGSNGKSIGHVKEIRTSDFLVDRDMARDIYVPFSQIRSVGAQVMLEITDDEVDNQGWENPPIL